MMDRYYNRHVHTYGLPEHGKQDLLFLANDPLLLYETEAKKGSCYLFALM